MTDDNVVALRPGPPINDIPGMLRQMADRFEAGDMTAEGVLFIVPRDGDWPQIFGWGSHLSDYGNIAVLELAKVWLVNNLTARDPK